MAASQSGSMADGMKKILGELAQMALLPDADNQFLMGLQQGITQYLRQAQSQTSASAVQGQGIGGGPQQGLGGQGGPDPMQQLAMAQAGGGAAGAAGPNAGPGAQAQAGGGGGMTGLSPGAVNPDELRRLLGANGQAA